jgi:outer membrane protein
MDGQFKASDGTRYVDESENLVLPMLYARGRVEIPGTDIGFEAEGKYLGYKTSDVVDVSIKVDYTLVDIIPFVDLGLEVGYRMQTININAADSSSVDTSLNLDVDGVFVGIVGRF